jgi:hypothetical protein
MTSTHDEREEAWENAVTEDASERGLLMMILCRLDAILDIMETPRPECRIETGNIIPFPSPDPA